jgi:glycosyltransferase involved in cell wall biosynthesis
MTKVSIGIPVYNGEKYLAAALDSLLAQSFREFEIVISDNASTDRTSEICRAYQSKDPRVRYFRSDQNLGAAWNHNRVIELSSAPLFKWAASDDLHEPLFLERCVDALYDDPGVVLSHTYLKMIDEKGDALRYDRERCCLVDGSGNRVPPPDRNHVAEAVEPEVRFRDVLSHVWWCFQCFGVMRRDALLRTSRHGNYWGADKVLIAELAVQGRFHQVREQLFAQRIHDECSFGAKDIHQLEEHIDSAGSRGFYHFLMFKDYIKLAVTADLRLRQRMHCLSSVARLTLRPGPWRQVLHRFDLLLGRA